MIFSNKRNNKNYCCNIKRHLSRTMHAHVNLSKGNRRIRLIAKSRVADWRDGRQSLTFSSIFVVVVFKLLIYLCNASHEMQVYINVVKWKKILRLNCWDILIDFFRCGFKMFYPICCPRKRSADTSTLYTIRDHWYKLSVIYDIINRLTNVIVNY